MKKLSVLLALMLLALPVATTLGAAAFPASTNDANRTRGRHYVEQASMSAGETTLNFVNPQTWSTCFEYRTDGDTSQALATPNPNPALPDRYPHLCVSNSTVVRTFQANGYIEIRSTFGAESDDFFDWVRFNVIPVPSSQSQAAEIMPFVVTDPAWFGAPMSVYWQWPDGSRDLLHESTVGPFGDISFVVAPSALPANDGYGLFQTTDPNRPEIAVWGRLLAVVNGATVQDVVVAACVTACEPQSYIVAADLTHQALRSSSIWYWASQ